MYVHKNSLQCILVWVTFYVLLALHSYRFLRIHDFFVEAIIYPLSALVILFLITYNTGSVNFSASEIDAEQTIGKNRYLGFLNLLLMIPVFISIVVILAAEFFQTYDNLISWLTLLGVIIGSESGTLMKNRKTEKYPPL